VDLGNAADVLAVDGASVFRVEFSKVYECSCIYVVIVNTTHGGRVGACAQPGEIGAAHKEHLPNDPF
jgi:hypothetical protein